VLTPYFVEPNWNAIQKVEWDIWEQQDNEFVVIRSRMLERDEIYNFLSIRRKLHLCLICQAEC